MAAAVLILLVSVAFAAFFYVDRVHSSNAPDLQRVACVGDSITQITGYPTDLQEMLGSKSDVGNFGVSGSTISFNSTRPYIYQNALAEAEQFQPTTVIIMLGTNDARQDVYPTIGQFDGDYEQLIQQFEDLNSKPQIYLAIPPPVYNNTLGISEQDLSSGVIPHIEQVANATGLPVINENTPLMNHPNYFVDGVHPNDEGAEVIADVIYQDLT